jgi:hypothetical protein
VHVWDASAQDAGFASGVLDSLTTPPAINLLSSRAARKLSRSCARCACIRRGKCTVKRQRLDSLDAEDSEKILAGSLWVSQFEENFDLC